jgi:hypothetical protein
MELELLSLCAGSVLGSYCLWGESKSVAGENIQMKYARARSGRLADRFNIICEESWLVGKDINVRNQELFHGTLASKVA